jgi:hypothetical protein
MFPGIENNTGAFEGPQGAPACLSDEIHIEMKKRLRDGGMVLSDSGRSSQPKA